MKNILSILLISILLLLGNSFAQSKITVMTYNIHHGEGIDKVFDLDRIGDLIINNDVDLAGFQEVDKGIERSKNIDTPKKIGEYTEMYSAFEKNAEIMGGDYGNAILSKYKILKTANHHFTMPNGGEQRGLLHTLINVNGDTILFMNTHLNHIGTDDERMLNLSEIEEVLKNYKGLPFILVGDFNANPDNKMHQAMSENFIDVWKYLIADKEGYTFPSDKPDRRIDYIYISKEGLKKFKPISIKVLKSEASDHLPLLAEFEIIKN